MVWTIAHSIGILQELRRSIFRNNNGGHLMQAVLASQILSEITGRLALGAATPSGALCRNPQ